MRKHISAIATILLTMAVMTGCAHNPFASDKVHATLTVNPNQNGRGVYESYNDCRYGQTRAVKFPVVIEVPKGEYVEAEFKCDACGTVIKRKMTCYQSELFKCKCAVDGDENGNAREYIVLAVHDMEEEGESQQSK